MEWRGSLKGMQREKATCPLAFFSNEDLILAEFQAWLRQAENPQPFNLFFPKQVGLQKKGFTQFRVIDNLSSVLEDQKGKLRAHWQS